MTLPDGSSLTKVVSHSLREIVIQSSASTRHLLSNISMPLRVTDN